MATPTTILLYWDKTGDIVPGQGWVYRITFEDDHIEEEALIDWFNLKWSASRCDMQEAVVNIAEAYNVKITDGDVAVGNDDGAFAMWAKSFDKLGEF